MLSNKSKRFVRSTLRWKNMNLIVGIIFIISSFILPVFIMLSPSSPFAPYKQQTLAMIKAGRLQTEQILTKTDLEQKLKKRLLEINGGIAELYAAQSELLGKWIANFLFIIGIMWICNYIMGRHLERVFKELKIDISKEIK